MQLESLSYLTLSEFGYIAELAIGYGGFVSIYHGKIFGKDGMHVLIFNCEEQNIYLSLSWKPKKIYFVATTKLFPMVIQSQFLDLNRYVHDFCCYLMSTEFLCT